MQNPDTISASREIDAWAHEHGYVRSRETTLNLRRDVDGRQWYYSACYLLDEKVSRAVNADLARIWERRERMPVTASSDLLLREDE